MILAFLMSNREKGVNFELWSMTLILESRELVWQRKKKKKKGKKRTALWGVDVAKESYNENDG